MNNANEIKTDVLVIGGGMAGCRAALEAVGNNVKVTMVMKTGIGKGGATGPYWYGGMSLPTGDTDPQDNPEEMYKDIVRSAWGMCDEKLAKILAYEIVDRYNDLERWGFSPPNKVDGKFHQHKACFATRPRAITMFGFSPTAIEILKQQVEKHSITVRDDIAIVSLLTRGKSCVGALGIDKKGEFHVFKAKSTILATGGAAGIFPPRYDPQAAGAGYVMGYRAGADLINMEFIQMFAKLPLDFPVIPYFLNPEMYNALGDRFFPRYLPQDVPLEKCLYERMGHVPFSTSDDGKHIDIAIYKELLEGRGTKEGCVVLDFTKVAKQNALKEAEKLGLSHMFGPFMDLILAKTHAVRPDAHAFNGGLKINEKAETCIEGLYAAGETAGGPHGADRLGGNMIAACLVFGARAGKYAAERARRADYMEIDKDQLNEERYKYSNILKSKGNLRVSDLENQIRTLMWRSCLIVRNKEGLERCIKELKRIKNEDLPRLSLDSDGEIFRAVSIPSMLDASLIVAWAALQRTESRGGHYREDFPERDDVNMNKLIVINKAVFNIDG
ncbi:MAG: FAD-binding protein [Peptococcaceae bacterium]|nr:FAD-binding protein [Peptococcaceae bacterium]MDH7525968.1 FAD-binding protein [Peptococcaceae bacterium]